MAAAGSDKEKLYTRLTNIFLDKIRSGEWRPGRQIPTEEELCRSFDVSKITVRRAVTNLVFDGHLEKIQGRGTFVKMGFPRAGMSMKTTLVEGVFMPGDAENITVLEKSMVRVLDEGLIKRMGPVIDAKVNYLCRLKSKAGVPVLVNETFVPARMCPGFEDWDAEGGSVFEFLRGHGTSDIVKVVQTVEMARPHEKTAKFLNARPTTPCMIIHRVFMAAADITVAYSKTTARGDRFELTTEYERVK